MKTYKITGADAIRLAKRDALQIYCYANPLDDGGPVDIGLAREIVKDDPNLIYVMVAFRGHFARNEEMDDMPGYNVDDWFNHSGMYLGPDEDGWEPLWFDAEV